MVLEPTSVPLLFAENELPNVAPGKPPVVFALGVVVFADTLPGVNTTSDPGIISEELGIPL